MEPYELGSPIIDPTAYVAPGVRIFGDVHVGPNAVIMFGTVIRAELAPVRIGRESNIQDNCVIHTDDGLPSIIGSRVTVGHAAIVHGAVVGDHCLVGIGAMALNGSELGEGSWLAAGSVLTEGKDIPPGMLAVGTPARALRALTDDEVRRQDEGVDIYQRLAATYRAIDP
jgi:carbonic anhydrase/acetyltransferase-like protein (isoleucine patch superfamily)